MVSAFAHLPYRQRRNQELLHRLSDGILALKLEAQGRTHVGAFGMPDPREQRRDIAAFLADLESQVEYTTESADGTAVDIAFSGLAQRLVRDASGGIDDRIAQLDRLRMRLLTGADPLSDREYRLLDRLQALLEEETADDVRGLFRF